MRRESAREKRRDNWMRNVGNAVIMQRERVERMKDDAAAISVTEREREMREVVS